MTPSGMYRGKRKDNHKWVYGFYFCLHHSGEKTHVHHFIIPVDTPLPKERTIGEIQVEIDPDTLCRCLDFLDREGKSIYDGDLVKIYAYYSKEFFAVEYHKSIGKVILKNLICKGRDTDLTIWNSYELEVVGNIYDDADVVQGVRPYWKVRNL